MNNQNGKVKTTDTTQLRRVIIEDSDGYKHCYLVPDNIPDELAKQGILNDPPNLELWDWETLRKELHNKLVEHGYFTYRDVVNIDGFGNLVKSVFINKLVETYKLREIN